MKFIFDSQKFSKQLKQKRIIDEDISMRVLNKQLKIGISTISRYENGEIPDLLNYAKVCKWLGMPLSEFLIEKAK